MNEMSQRKMTEMFQQKNNSFVALSRLMRGAAKSISLNFVELLFGCSEALSARQVRF